MIFLRNSRMMQCLFLLSSIQSQGRSSLRQRASMENSLLPGRKAISSFQFKPFRYPIVRMESSSAEYFRNPPTLSSSFIILQMVRLHLHFASLSLHPKTVPIFYQLVTPSFSTIASSFQSSPLVHSKVYQTSSPECQSLIRSSSVSIFCSEFSGLFLLRAGLATSTLFLNLCERCFGVGAGVGGFLLTYFLGGSGLVFLAGCGRLLGTSLLRSLVIFLVFSGGYTSTRLQNFNFPCHLLMTESLDLLLLKCFLTNAQSPVPCFLMILANYWSYSSLHFNNIQTKIDNKMALVVCRHIDIGYAMDCAYIFISILQESIMLQKVREVPPKFYQLALFNIGLIVALSKELSPLHILLSLAFITVLTAPIAIYFKILDPENASIIHQDIQAKLSGLCTSSMTFLSNWQELDPTTRIKYFTNALLAVYISINYLCPCIETFLIFNAIFVYLFLQEQVEQVGHMICNAWSKCPIAK